MSPAATLNRLPKNVPAPVQNISIPAISNTSSRRTGTFRYHGIKISPFFIGISVSGSACRWEQKKAGISWQSVSLSSGQSDVIEDKSIETVTNDYRANTIVGASGAGQATAFVSSLEPTNISSGTSKHTEYLDE